MSQTGNCSNEPCVPNGMRIRSATPKGFGPARPAAPAAMAVLPRQGARTAEVRSPRGRRRPDVGGQARGGEVAQLPALAEAAARAPRRPSG